MKRALLYLHFNKLNRVSGHVFYQLKHMQPLFSKIVFLSNSPLPAEVQQHLREELGIADIIERRNIGFDFAAWRDGMQYLGFDSLTDYDSLTLMNDTCFGPLWDLQETYQLFEDDNQVDFWGMTNFRKTKYFEEHLQSYFLSFKRSILQSQVFQDFWSQVKDSRQVQEVIDQYETRFTKFFQEAGFAYKPLFDTRDLQETDLIHPDYSYYRPLEILTRKVPFLKVKAFDGNPFLASHLLEQLSEQSDYPLDLIKGHLFTYFAPDLPCLLADKYLAESKEVSKVESPVLLHIHVTDLAILESYSQHLQSLSSAYDFLLTAPKAEILEDASHLLESPKRKMDKLLCPQSQSILAFLAQKERLADYTYVGHLSTQKLAAEPILDKAMRSDLLTAMIDYADASIHHLQKEEKLGLVIPDCPAPVATGLIEQVADLESLSCSWQKLGCKKPYDFTNQSIFAKVYGGFFWCKFAVLAPLFQLGKDGWQGYSEQELAELVDYLLVYLAWEQDYDFWIMKSRSPRPALLDLQIRQQQLRKLEEALTRKTLPQKVLTGLSNLFKSK